MAVVFISFNFQQPSTKKREHFFEFLEYFQATFRSLVDAQRISFPIMSQLDFGKALSSNNIALRVIVAADRGNFGM